MSRIHRSRPLLVALAVTFVVMTAAGFLPLFAGPGYESALAAGLTLPSIAAVASAIAMAHHRPSPSVAFVRAIETALLVNLVAYGTMMLHGLRAGFCDIAAGSALFVLGPGAGALVGATWGMLAGEVAGRVQRRRWRYVLAVVGALAGPVAGVLISLLRFYTSPMVFAFDPFIGFFSGALYDTVVTDMLANLLTYRVGTLATLIAAGAASALLMRKEASGKLSIASHRHPGVAWLAVGAALVSVIANLEGWRMGHWQTAATITRALGGRIADDRCEVIYPRAISDEAARLLLRDCSTQSREVMSFLGLTQAPRSRAYFFDSPEQKRRLTGAGRTSVAKPWRHEVYVQLEGYPHPILGHELAHVLAGVAARGPFAIAGSWAGWLPNPGLIEGIAVAASPDDDALTPQQWSAAMLRLGILPPLEKVFALGFLAENSSKSYTVAGAFIGWLRDRNGIGAVRSVYGGASFESAMGASLAELESAWRQGLEHITLAPQELDFARARFDRPAVFGRRCPHAVDALVAQGRELASQGDCVGAAMAYEQASTLDPHDGWSRMGLAYCCPRLRGTEAAVARWKELAANQELPSTFRQRARESLADLYLVDGQLEQAASIYSKLLEQVVDEDRLRTLDVKLRATRNRDEARAIGELLIGGPTRAPDHKLAFALLGRWMVQQPGDGLPAYLIGRNLAASGLWLEAGQLLDWALDSNLSEPRVQREALRLRIVTACALLDTRTARRVFDRWTRAPGLPANQIEVLKRRLGSCVMQPSPSLNTDIR